MKENSSDRTQLYSQDDGAFDDALKTFEKTVTGSGEKRPFPVRKIILILCICVAVLAIGAAAIFLLTQSKSYPPIIVKTVNGNYSLAGKELTALDHSVKTLKVSHKNCTCAFVDEKNDLYALKTDKFKTPDDAKLLANDFGDSFYVCKGSFVVYLSGGDLYYYDFKNLNCLAENVTEVFQCENSEKMLYLTSDKTLYSTDLKTSQQIASAVEKIDFHSDGKDMNLIYVSGGKLFYCNDTVGVKLLSEKSVEWVCGEENEVWDNVYFYEKSQGKRSFGIEFEDKNALSDAQMKAPVSSDYSRSLVFGLIRYVDPAQYKAAYVEYQKKLMRDTVREYAKNFSDEAECFDVLCFNSFGVQTVKQNVFKDEVLSFSKEGAPKIIINVPTEEKTKIEISDLASVIKLNQIDSQEKFDEYVLQTYRKKNSSGVLICSLGTELSLAINKVVDYDNIIFTKNSDILLIEQYGIYSLWKISENSLEKIFENEIINEYFFEENMMLFSDKNNEFFFVDFANNFEKKTVAKNVDKINKNSDGFYLISAKNESGLFDCLTFKGGEVSQLAKNCSDFLFVNEEEYFYVSQNNIYCNYAGKLYVQNDVAEIVK